MRRLRSLLESYDDEFPLVAHDETRANLNLRSHICMNCEWLRSCLG